MSANNSQQKLFKEQDLQELIKHIYLGRAFSMEKPTKKIVLQLAQTFIEEVLDLPAGEKMNITKEAIDRQIHAKFPEISRGDPSLEVRQRRNMEIQKEDIF